jgi:hypothetical protein
MKSLSAIAALSLLFIGVLRAQDEDPFAGTWTLNVQKSKLAKPVRSATMRLRIVIDEADIGLSMEKMDVERVYAEGVREALNYSARYSGGDYGIVDTVTGTPIGEEAKVRMIDASTREFSRLRNRKPLSVSRRVLSPDRKTLTVTTTTPDGTVQDVEIWQRQ